MLTIMRRIKSDMPILILLLVILMKPAHGTCPRPSLKWGEVWCDEIAPGASCRAVCEPGFIATPGKEVTTCGEDGNWTVDLHCEIPLILISGGIVDSNNTGDSGVELLSFYPSQGCERNMSSMPLAGGSHRMFHNLVFVPPHGVLACNGLTGENNATCDYLHLKNNTWRRHSYPNEGLSSRSMHWWREEKYSGKGRYAAQSLRMTNHTVVVGGMVYDENGHNVSNSMREIADDATEWTHFNQSRYVNSDDKGRAFFCAVKMKEYGFLSIGGLEHDYSTKKNKVGTGVHFQDIENGFRGEVGGPWMFMEDNNMDWPPRAGHGCTAIPFKRNHIEDEFFILVSGGASGLREPAIASAKIFNWPYNRWNIARDMKTPRFGHALVAVGKKILALGGDDRDPSNVLDTVEEYNVGRNTWRLIQKKLKKPRSNFGYTLVPHSVFDGCVVTGLENWISIWDIGRE